jgi:hypothetical protein
MVMLHDHSAVVPMELTEDQSLCFRDAAGDSRKGRYVPRYQSAMIELRGWYCNDSASDYLLMNSAKACEVWPKGKMATDFDQPSSPINRC